MRSQRPYKLGYNLKRNEKIDGVLLKLRETLILEICSPANIVEIGTYAGGLAFLLKDTFREAKVYTFDPRPSCDMEKLSLDAGVICHRRDVFEAKELIRGIVQSEGLSMVFCDGGNKRREFNEFAPYLKPGDIILAHDYAPDREYWTAFMKDRIWNWFEIQDSHVEECCAAQDLGSFLREEFLATAWLCQRKSLDRPDF